MQCDEAQPRCTRCAGKDQHCTYAHLTTSFNPFQHEGQKRVPEANSLPLVPRTNRFRFLPPEQIPYKDKSAVLPPNLPEEDQELYDHYVSKIGPIFERVDDRDVLCRWHDANLRFFHSHNYVYHIVLAFSATHMALVDEDVSRKEALIETALQHQNEALTRFRPILDNINSQNCEPALLCAAEVTSCSFALPLAMATVQGHLEDPLEHLKRFIGLFDGLTTLYRMGWTASLDHNISPAIRNQILTFQQTEASASEAEASLDFFEREVVGTVQEEKLKRLWHTSILKLKRTHRRLASHPKMHTLILMWPGMVHPGYLKAVKDHDPIALVILAHWAPCLHQIRHLFWIGDWGSWILEAVQKTLGEDWSRFLIWPSSQFT